jgi:hypothetical protein
MANQNNEQISQGTDNKQDTKFKYIFFGHGKVFDPVQNVFVCTFGSDGRLGTNNDKLAAFLRKRGYKEEIPKVTTIVSQPGIKGPVPKVKIEEQMFNEEIEDGDAQKPEKVQVDPFKTVTVNGQKMVVPNFTTGANPEGLTKDQLKDIRDDLKEEILTECLAELEPKLEELKESLENCTVKNESIDTVINEIQNEIAGLKQSFSSLGNKLDKKN